MSRRRWFPGNHTHAEKDDAEQQHEDGSKHVVWRVVTGHDVTDSHDSVAALGDHADRDDDREVAIEVRCGRQEKDRQREIEYARDLDLPDVQRRPRRDSRVEPPREDGSSNAEGEVRNAKEPK